MKSKRSQSSRIKKPVLKRLADSITWESFRSLLGQGYAQESNGNAERKRINPLILFKMLVLQQLFNWGCPGFVDRSLDVTP
jgi:IS5 family transposase